MKTILLVDPIHSVGFLHERLKEKNIRTIALFSNMDLISEFNRPKSNVFDRQIHISNESLDEILEIINEDVDFVLNGSDQHLEFCETLANKITPKLSNDLNDLYKRKTKFSQQETLDSKKYKKINQVLINRDNPNYEVVNCLKFPVFAKPENGGGSIGIFKAENMLELKKGIEKSPKIVNFDRVDNYLIQDYICGDEVIIDGFSYNGKHYFSNVATYKKKNINGTPVYRTIENINDSKVVDKVLEFTSNILNDIGYKNGFSHTELFLTRDGDLYLIEMNPRISGASGTINIMASISFGRDQVDLLADCLNDINIENNIFDEIISYSKTMLIYNHENIDLSEIQTLNKIISISNTKLDIDRNPDLTDLRKLIVISSKNKKEIDIDENKILSMDIF